jgi:hypothetical protein
LEAYTSRSIAIVAIGLRSSSSLLPPFLVFTIIVSASSLSLPINLSFWNLLLAGSRGFFRQILEFDEDLRNGFSLLAVREATLKLLVSGPSCILRTITLFDEVLSQLDGHLDKTILGAKLHQVVLSKGNINVFLSIKELAADIDNVGRLLARHAADIK